MYPLRAITFQLQTYPRGREIFRVFAYDKHWQRTKVLSKGFELVLVETLMHTT